jgi:hypothetical protein
MQGILKRLGDSKAPPWATVMEYKLTVLWPSGVPSTQANPT